MLHYFIGSTPHVTRINCIYYFKTCAR